MWNPVKELKASDRDYKLLVAALNVESGEGIESARSVAAEAGSAAGGIR